jgi:hypothetical protein
MHGGHPVPTFFALTQNEPDNLAFNKINLAKT